MFMTLVVIGLVVLLFMFGSAGLGALVGNALVAIRGLVKPGKAKGK
jgi:hypothetical protein